MEFLATPLSVSFNLIPYLRQMNMKWQSFGCLIDTGSYQKTCSKILSYTNCRWKSQVISSRGQYLLLSLKSALFKITCNKHKYWSFSLIVLMAFSISAVTMVTQFLSQVSSKLLIYLNRDVTLPFENMGRVPQHIRGRNTGCFPMVKLRHD